MGYLLRHNFKGNCLPILMSRTYFWNIAHELRDSLYSMSTTWSSGTHDTLWRVRMSLSLIRLLLLPQFEFHRVCELKRTIKLCSLTQSREQTCLLLTKLYLTSTKLHSITNLNKSFIISRTTCGGITSALVISLNWFLVISLLN